MASAGPIDADALHPSGSHAKAREASERRSEGREYLVKDGDMVEFQFNVQRQSGCGP